MLDIHSPTWQTLTKQVEEDLVVLRERLEQPGLPMDKTEYLRGEIARCKQILALATPPVREGGSTPDYGLL